MAPAFEDDFFPPLPPPLEVDVLLVGFVVPDDELDPGRVELREGETVEGTAASVSGRPPADSAFAGSNLSPT